MTSVAPIPLRLLGSALSHLFKEAVGTTVWAERGKKKVEEVLQEEEEYVVEKVLYH